MWGGIGGSLVQDDSRVTYSLGQPYTGQVNSVTLFPAIPARRWETNQIIIGTSFPGIPGSHGASYQIKVPVPLTPGFTFDGTNYVCKMQVPLTGGPGDYNGRLVAAEPLYSPGSYGADCGYDGTHFPTYADEQAHNVTRFQLSGGAISRTFNATSSQASFASTVTSGSLGYDANSEVGGSISARAFFPAIVRVSATFAIAGRVTVDISSTISPTATITGTYVEDGARSTSAAFAMSFIDHFEAGGVSYAPVVGGAVYIPSKVFDIVFKESTSVQTGSLTLNAVVDADALPPDSTDIGDAYPGPTSTGATTLAGNARMSIPALLYVSANPVPPKGRFLVRPSNEIMRRTGTHLWQHKGNARFWGIEVGIGKGGVFKSDDEGVTYQSMANAWTGVSGAVPLAGGPLGDSGGVSIAAQGGNVVCRTSVDCINWDAIQTVCPYASGSWSVGEREVAGVAQIIVENAGISRYVSSAGGVTGSWSAS
ncbi:hypothetical protein IAD21_00869 [Abditibacteriota bacterium]|nr:hypothetical protein IAD21_00869 [Abditibacteriota bacterium]